MKQIWILALTGLFINITMHAQRSCGQSIYLQQQISRGQVTPGQVKAAESFISRIIQSTNTLSRTTQNAIIRIPVIVHILYHYPDELITDEQVRSQITVLNRDFRRRNPDSVKTPAYFKSLAADCEIEFVLASSDPQKRPTTGIIRKYTPVLEWEADDKIKSSAETGDDGWDPGSYLNIWVGKMNRVAGYSSVMGGPVKKDGIVIDRAVFGSGGNGGGHGVTR